MIKTLRIRFVVTTMVLVLIILTVLIGFINVINFKRTTDNADDILEILSYNDGVFAPDFKPIPDKDEESSSSIDGPGDGENGEESVEDEGEPKPEPTPDHISIETPFETRYFSVRFSESGAIADTTHIATFSESEAIQIASSVLNDGVSHGYYESYRFLVDESKSLVIFIDWTRQIELARDFRIASILSAIGGAMVIFVIALLLSAKAVSPIAEAYERQRRFIADASHELKTPLTIISANNELIEITEGENEYTASINKQVARMTNMVKNLSSLASMDEATRKARQSTFSLSDVCSELCDTFYPVLRRDGRKFDISIENEIEFTGDETLIRLLISTLLENAGKYAISYTSLDLCTVGKRWQLTLSNDATGVEEGNLTRCFERFYRSDEARASSVEGSGIGLCVAEEIVVLHGGEISAHGLNNTFTIKVII